MHKQAKIYIFYCSIYMQYLTSHNLQLISIYTNDKGEKYCIHFNCESLFPFSTLPYVPTYNIIYPVRKYITDKMNYKSK